MPFEILDPTDCIDAGMVAGKWGVSVSLSSGINQDERDFAGFIATVYPSVVGRSLNDNIPCL